MPTDPTALVGTRSRQALPVLATVLMVLALTLGATRLTGDAEPVVPFRPLAAEPASSEQPDGDLQPSQEAPPGTPACRAQDLQAVDLRQESNGEQALLEITAINNGRTCALLPKAAVRVLRRDGAEVAINAKQEPPQEADRVQRLLVPAGQQVRSRIIVKGRACGAVPEGAALRYGANDSGDVSARVMTALSCRSSNAAAAASIGNWRPGLPAGFLDPEPLKGPYDGASLTVSISDVKGVSPGQDLDFQVELRNTGAEPFALTPCPDYTMALSGEGDEGTTQVLKLNCAEMPSALEPGAAIRLQMQLPTPPALREGLLRWTLGPVETARAPSSRTDYVAA